VILGCVGGIGVFLAQAGVEISTGLKFAWTADGALAFAHGAALARWSLSLALALCLRALGRCVRDELALKQQLVARVRASASEAELRELSRLWALEPHMDAERVQFVRALAQGFEE
jgi:hypothetical protein